MIQIPDNRIRVIGGKMKDGTKVSFFSFLEDDGSINPRPMIANNDTATEIEIMEILGIRQDALKCRLDSVNTFGVMTSEVAKKNPRDEIIWDLALFQLTRTIEFDLRKDPFMKVSLSLKNSSKIYSGIFEDCTILAEFLPALFDFDKQRPI